MCCKRRNFHIDSHKSYKLSNEKNEEYIESSRFPLFLLLLQNNPCWVRNFNRDASISRTGHPCQVGKRSEGEALMG